MQKDDQTSASSTELQHQTDSGMWKSPAASPRRLSDISPQLRQLKFLAVEEEIKEDFKSSRSVEDIKNASIEERILRITGYYGYQPWSSTKPAVEKPNKDRVEVKTDSHIGTNVINVESTSRQQTVRCCLCWTVAYLKQALWGVTVVLCICSSWTGATQLAKLTLRQLNVPFTLTWFSTSWNCLLFPLYYLGHLCWSKERQSLREHFRQCCQFLGDEGLSVKTLLTVVAPFGVMWTLTSYLYLQGLRRIPATDASALFCCSRAFVFLISWIVLRDRFMGVRMQGTYAAFTVIRDQISVCRPSYMIVAAILAIAGIVMITYADGFHGHSVIGISLVVGSASTAAMYKVLFRLVLGSAKLGEAALYLTVLGGANMVFVSIVPLILILTGAEDIGLLRDIPWHTLCGTAVLLLVFNFLINFGVLITLPTLISLSIVLSVPVNAVIDCYMCEIQFNSVRIIAVSTICLGFLLLLLPEDWDHYLLQLHSMVYNRKKPHEGSRDTHTETLHAHSSKTGHCNAVLKTACSH